MFVVWRTRVERVKQFALLDTEEEARNYSFPPPPTEDIKEYKKLVESVEVEGKTKYAVWLVRLAKLETYGGFYSFAEADAKKVPLGAGETKLVEKIYTNTENYCGNCKRLVMAMNKRAALDRKRRATAMMVDKKGKVVKGQKPSNIIPISDQDARGFMKFLVEKKIEQDAKAKESITKK